MNRERALNLPFAILFFGGCLILVHVVRQVLSEDSDVWVLLSFGFIPARYGELGAMLPGGAWARLWTPVTHAFLHDDWAHLFNNLLWLVIFVTPLARRFGTLRFLLLGGFAAIAGAGSHYALYAGEETLLIGASGAISGMMAGTVRFAFGPNGPLGRGASRGNYRLPAQSLGALLTNKQALVIVLVWFGSSFVLGLFGDSARGMSDPIAWEAHAGGFIAGLLMFPLLDPVPRETNRLAS